MISAAAARQNGILINNQANGIINTRQFPLIDQYRNEKDWRIQVVKFYISTNLQTISYLHAMFHASIRMYNAITETSEVPDYAKDSKGKVLNSVMYDYVNPLFNPINVRLGEFAGTDYVIHSYLRNKAAESRKQDFYTQARMQQILKERMPNTAEMLDPTAIGDAQSMMQAEGMEGQLDEFMEKKYRDLYDTIADKLIQDWKERSYFKPILDQIYRYYLLTDTAVAWVELNPHTLEVDIQVENPCNVVWDTEMTDDLGRDMQFCMRYRYQSENEILLKYPKIKREDLDSMASRNTPAGGYLRPYYIDQRDNETRFLVTETRWKYVKKKSVADAKEGLGIPPSDNDSEQINYEEVYYSIQIGDEIEIDGGVLSNQVRSVDFFGNSNLGVFVLRLGQSLSPRSPTELIRVEGLIKQRNLVFFKLMQMVADMKGVVMFVDTSIIPTMPNEDGVNEPRLDVLADMMQQDKIVPVNGMQLGGAMDAMGTKIVKPVELIEVGVPAGMDYLRNQLDFLTMEINRMLAYNDARVGSINKYETKTNAQMNKSASDKATAYKDVQFDNFVERTLEYVANSLKIADTLTRVRAGYYNNTKLIDAIEMRLGDEVATLPRDSFLFQDIGIHIRRRVDSAERKMMIEQQFLPMALQSGNITLSEYATFLTSDNLEDAFEKIQEDMRKKEIAAQKQQQEQMMQQQQMQEQMMQQQMQMQQQLKEMETNSKMMLEELKGNIKLRNSTENAKNNAAIQEANQLQNMAVEQEEQA
jgi:hypothetical protein